MDIPILKILIIVVVAGGVNALIAKLKGFNPFLWFFTAGLLGLILVVLLPSAKKVEKGTEEYNQRRARANWLGLCYCDISISVRNNRDYISFNINPSTGGV